jgi:hypothetical protein
MEHHSPGHQDRIIIDETDTDKGFLERMTSSKYATVQTLGILVGIAAEAGVESLENAAERYKERVRGRN